MEWRRSLEALGQDPEKLGRLALYGLAEHGSELFEAPDLGSCQGKLAWGKKHLETLRGELQSAEGRGAHTFSVEHDAETRQYIFKVTGIAEAEPRWGYIVGDCVHNLRSALDGLFLQLARLGQGGRRLTGKEVRSCSFPIFPDADRFEQTAGLKLLRPGERTRLWEVQPFNAREMSIWGADPKVITPGRVYPANLPGLLHDLSLLDNIDKHRGVHVAWRGVAWYATPEPPEPFRLSSVSAAAVTEGAEVGRWSFESDRPDLPEDLDADQYFPVRAAIGHPHGAWGYGALDLLDWFVRAVEMVIGWFGPCFVRGDPVAPLVDLDVTFEQWDDRNWLLRTSAAQD